MLCLHALTEAIYTARNFSFEEYMPADKKRKFEEEEEEEDDSDDEDYVPSSTSSDEEEEEEEEEEEAVVKRAPKSWATRFRRAAVASAKVALAQGACSASVFGQRVVRQEGLSLYSASTAYALEVAFAASVSACLDSANGIWTEISPSRLVDYALSGFGN
jgi:hypothetical protein